MSAMYDPGREGFLDGSIDWDTDDVRVLAVGSGYTFSAAHRYVTDLGANILARSSALSSKAVTNGVADAADISIPGLPGSTAVQGVVVYKYNASDGSARLIAFINSGTGLPVTTSSTGGQLDITWDNGSLKIFKL